MAKIADVVEAPATSQALKRGFYWLGMLPAVGKVTFPMPKRDKPFVEDKEFDSYSLWMNGLEEGMRVFVAKLRQYTGAAVSGWNFSGVTECVEMSGTEVSRTSYPGQVSWFGPSEVERIIRSCFRHFVRFQFGVDRMNDVNQKTDIWSLDLNARPKGMADADWYRFSANGQIKVPEFDPRLDKLMAEFVYVQYLGDSRSHIDEVDYARNPNKYHVRMVPALSADFFRNPPKSVAEVYPHLGA